MKYNPEGNYYEVKAGDVVYDRGSPQNPGLVISTEVKEREYKTGLKQKYQMAKVRWLKNKTITVKGHPELGNVKLKGKILDVPSGYLMDFDELIADHEKKLNTHRGNLKALELEIAEEYMGFRLSDTKA